MKKCCESCYKKKHFIKEYVFGQGKLVEKIIVCRYTKREFKIDNMREEIDCPHFVTPIKYFKE